MSLSSPQTLSADSATDVDTNTDAYVLRAADLNRSEFSVSGLTLPEEQKLTVSHDTGKGGEKRHMVRLDHTVVDAFGVPATASVYMVAVRPINTAVTNAVIIALVNQLVDFLIEGGTNANVTAILNNEV